MNTAGILRCLVGSKWLTTASLQIPCGSRNPSIVFGLFYNHEQTREMSRVKRRTTHPPYWHRAKNLKTKDDPISSDSSLFIKEYIQDKYQSDSPLKGQELVKTEWDLKTKRAGVIARNIGVYQMWRKDGSQVLCTLLHVLDNHVIRYIPPEQYINTKLGKNIPQYKNIMGCLIVGAEATNPEKFTRQYCNMFTDVGLMPKKRVTRFVVTPNAALLPGTPLTAGHFRVGQVVDVCGKTIDHGFQGVMKRWGFKGGPASHGSTKFHRKGGTIGSGRDKARVYPGTKMPGHMGSERRYAKGLKIMRINMKYNIIYVHGPVPGGTNSIVHILDTILPLRKLKEAPPHPTYFPPEDGSKPEDDIYDPCLHVFGSPSITAA